MGGLLEAPFNVSAKCCDFMKKNPLKLYKEETGRHPIIATMANESFLRRNIWMRFGCNSFGNRAVSRPMSFWTEQDVLHYIDRYNLSYASVYGSIKKDNNGKYYTTGVARTGCVFCGFGAHLEKEPNRFQKLKQSHPNLWEYCMKQKEAGGLGMKEPLEYIGIKVD